MGTKSSPWEFEETMENHVAYVLTKDDGTQRLVFAVGSLEAAELFSIENRSETEPFVAATKVGFGVFEIDRNLRPACHETMVPNAEIEDCASIVDGEVEDLFSRLAAEPSASVRGWRGIAKDGRSFVLVVDRGMTAADAASCMGPLVGGLTGLNRIIGGSYPAVDGVPFGTKRSFGETWLEGESAPSVRM
jgi:hypothetical protein